MRTNRIRGIFAILPGDFLPVGIYSQPNDWTCGPFALKHALVAMGRLANEAEISKVASPHWWAGTSENKLTRAARHFGCDLPLIRRRDDEGAFRSLTQYTSKRVPCILCVDDWGHWVTVVRNERDRFVMLDSKMNPVLQVVPWGTLRRRWLYQENDERPLYELLPVRPRSAGGMRADFSVARAQFLRRPENHRLALHWDDYLEDLLEICKPQTRRYHRPISMGEFLRRNQELLISRASYWHGDIEGDSIRKLLRNFRFVAETYGLVIPATDAKRALVDLSMLVAMWTAAKKGIGPMYGSDK